MVMNLKSIGSNFIFKEIENPFLNKKTDSGLDISGGTVFSQDSGELELSNKIIGTGIVLETGPDCRQIKVGDLVYYDRRGPRPIVNDEIYWCTNELNVFSYIEKGLF